MSSPNRAAPQPSQIEEAVEAWRVHFQSELSRGVGPEAVEAVVAPVARDRAWVAYGGSGRRAMQVLIDDHLQASFEFDGSDSLIAFSVFERRATWLKRPGNVLVHGAPDGEEMILLAE